jgi:serine/threonine protein kinase
MTQGGVGVGPVTPVPSGSSPPPPGVSVDFSSLGDIYTYQQLLLATGDFGDVNLIKYGHSGDLYKGISESGIPVVIKKIDLQSHRKEAYLLELDFFSKVSNPRLVPLLGHCLEKENEKFLIYKHMPNGDLSSSLYRKTNSEDGLKSLDWITRLKIAIGAAEGLSYLHHECTPPIVHRYSEDTLLIVALFTFLFVISFCCQSQ